MDKITVRDRQFTVSISEERIKARVAEIAAQISHELEDKKPLFLAVLNGSFVFAADLMRGITTPCEISFVRMASYEGTSSTGSVKQLIGLKEDIKDRTVVIIEDIIDSGRTLSYLLPVLRERKPKSLKLLAFLDKPDRRVKEVPVDYTGFEIPDEFVVGYGLDYAQKYRNLPYVGIVEV